MLDVNQKARVLDELAYIVFSGNLRPVTEEEEEPEEEARDYPIMEGLDPVPQLLNRAAKGGAKKGKKCTTGQVCGLSCISKTKTCRKDLTPAQKPKAKKAKTKTPKGGGGAVAQQVATQPAPVATETKPTAPYTAEEQAALNHPHKQNLYGIAMGGADTRSPEVAAKQDKALRDFNLTYQNQAAKIDRLMEAGLTQAEADGVAVWVDSEYKPMNLAIYNPSGVLPEQIDYAFGAGVRAAEGLKKLPSYKHEDLVASSPAELLGAGQLRRGIEFVGDIDSFLSPYESAVGKPEYKEQTFFATSALKQQPFLDGANVVYEIKSKSDGSGQGKAVDSFKNGIYEGEVVYPPYSRFKVTGVERPEKLLKSSEIVKLIDPAELQGLPKKVQDELGAGLPSASAVSQLKAIANVSLAYQQISADPSPTAQKYAQYQLSQLTAIKAKPLSAGAAQALKNYLEEFGEMQPIKIFMEEL